VLEIAGLMCPADPAARGSAGLATHTGRRDLPRLGDAHSAADRPCLKALRKGPALLPMAL
jgi:hypothetical protein